jgi:hypothetical protein
MSQIHRRSIRRGGSVLLIDSGSIALNPCNAVTHERDGSRSAEYLVDSCTYLEQPDDDIGLRSMARLNFYVPSREMTESPSRA